jgi:phosphoribosyl-AMP cyclohydrolase
MNALDKIQFNEKGLVPVITQDFVTSEVLMMAWMNKEALSLSIKTKKVVYFNKSLRFTPTATRTLLCSK